jgi:2-oxoglutarate ferredoxin oxidoreductase subunit alpha
MPRNLGEILSRFRTVVVCEMNMGQLQMLLRARYLVDAYGLHKVRGRPFMVSDIRAKIDEVLGGR